MVSLSTVSPPDRTLLFIKPYRGRTLSTWAIRVLALLTTWQLGARTLVSDGGLGTQLCPS